MLSDIMRSDESEIKEKLESLREGILLLEKLDSSNFKDILEDIIFLIFQSSTKIRKQIRENLNLGIDFSDVFKTQDIRQQIDTICRLILLHAKKYPKGETPLHPLVKKVLQIIETNYADGLSLKTLADQLSVSQVHMGRLFKRDTGKLFTEYLCDFRIEKAKQLLLKTNLKSNKIAEAVGFSNPNYFSNVFKKRVGVYPTRYRNQQT